MTQEEDSGSRKVLVISLIGDAAIAAIKFTAALFTGSASMMAEAAHSTSDCGNELLLFYGLSRAKKQNDKHPLGSEREMFFWAFMVALLLFTSGGLFSLHEGWDKIHAPEPVEHAGVGIAVFILSMIFEVFALRACLKDIAGQNPHGSLWKWIKYTANVNLLVTTLVNVASMAGLIIGLFSLTLAMLTGNSMFDGLGSLAIGVLLILTALVLVHEIKSLLIGESTAFDYQTPIAAMLKDIVPEARIPLFISMHCGMERVLVAYKIHPGTNESVMDAIAMTNRLEDQVRERFPEIKWQFVELDTRDYSD
jgi:cation diffusion facilitator family transporter